MDLSPSKSTLQRQKSTTDVWFGRNPDELPYRKLAPLQREIFAAYSGPGDGLCHVEELEKKLQFADPSAKHKGICGSESWTKKNRKAYGISTSLYDQHPIKKCISGDPIADAFALCARMNNSLLVIADGVNWGEKSMLAARCAVYGAAHYINDQLFEAQPCPVKTTQDAFHLLLKAMEHAHSTILRHEGGLTTLCIALVLATRAKSQYAVCIANVGDSLAYVYSKAHGIREITTGSHDISSERDIRDAGGALGPVNGTNPELNNLTCSMTYVDVGDIVFLTTDGISDNYDPVVTKIAVPKQIKPPTPPMSQETKGIVEAVSEETNSKPCTSESENAVEKVTDSNEANNSRPMQVPIGAQEINGSTLNDSKVQSKCESEKTGDESKDNDFNKQELLSSDSDLQNGERVQNAIDIKNTNLERISNKSSFKSHQTQDSNLNVKSEISNSEISAETCQLLNSTANKPANTHHFVNTQVESVSSVQNTNSLSSQRQAMDNDPKIAPQRQSNSGLQSGSSNNAQERISTLGCSNELSNQLNANILSSTPHDDNNASCDQSLATSIVESNRSDLVEPVDSQKTAENLSKDFKGQKRRSEAYVDELKSPKSSIQSKLSHGNRPKSRTLPVKSVSLDCPSYSDKSTKKKKVPTATLR